MADDLGLIKALLATQDKEATQEMLQKVLERYSRERTTRTLSLTPTERVDLLKRRYKSLLTDNNFYVGQLVKWKDSLKNKKRPDVGEPAIVIEILSEPIFDMENGAGSPYFREPLDLLLGIIDEDGDFVTFYYDKRRFEPFESSA